MNFFTRSTQLRLAHQPLSGLCLLLSALAAVTQVSCAQDSRSNQQSSPSRFTEHARQQGPSVTKRETLHERALPRGTVAERIQALNGKGVQVTGPNCWNAVLLSAGIAQSKRYVSKAEFWFWMRSPYCRKKAPSEPLKAGDIGSIFHESMDGNYHSFVVLDGEVFSKNSPFADTQYKIQAYEDMFKPEWRERASACKGTQSQLAEKNCAFQVVHHECTPLPTDFYSRYPDLNEINDEVTKIEKKLERYAEKKSGHALAVLSPAFKRLRELAKQLKGKMANTEKDLVVNAIGFRILGNVLLDPESREDLSEDAQRALESAAALEEKAKDKYVPATIGEI